MGLGGMTAATLYGSWSAFDAFETAQRQNLRGRPGLTPTPGEDPTHLQGPKRPLGP
jgi:hypothetical protein